MEKERLPWSALSNDLYESKEPWIELLSWKPRAFLYHNFLTDEEADHIVAEAKPTMMKSTVLSHNGESMVDSIRTSYGTFLSRFQTPTLAAVQRRVAQWTMLPVSHQEDTQILRYSIGQKYGAHYDVLDEDSSPRVATVLIYLRSTKEGGETAFPEGSEWIDESLPERLGPFSRCTNGGVATKPKKGDAILFYSVHPDGHTQDGASLHTGCPVLDGIKWTATFWIHSRPFRPGDLGKNVSRALEFDPSECEDKDIYCKGWAINGECKKNPAFMIGDAFGAGACRFSCKACEKCRDGDDICRSRNRVKAGYLSLKELEED